MINWNESCVACIDIWPLFWQRIDHSTLSQCTLSDYLKSIFVLLYFLPYSSFTWCTSLLPLLLLINSIYMCVCWNLPICLNVYLHICICVFVHLPYATPPCFRQSPQLPPLPPLLLINSSWDPADTQICGGTTASRTLLQHIFQIAQKSCTNFAQILHIYQHSCTKLHNSCKNISQISQYLTQWLHLHSALWRMTSPAGGRGFGGHLCHELWKYCFKILMISWWCTLQQ